MKRFTILLALLLAATLPVFPQLIPVAGQTGGSGASTASAVAFTPAGNIAATTVQAMGEELDAEKCALTGCVFTGPLTGTSDIVDIQRTTNAQILRVFKTRTSLTNFETLLFDAATDPLAYHIGTDYGTAGGSPRQLIMGGGTNVTDAAPEVRGLFGKSAYAQASTNTTGGNVILSGGLGRRFYTFVTPNSTGGKTFTITANGTAVVLTEGSSFNCNTLTTTQCATNLATAINANGTLGPLMTAAGSGASCYLTKKTTLYSLTIATNAGAPATATSGTDGVVNAPGGLVTTSIDSGAATNLPLKYNGTTKVDIGTSLITFSGAAYGAGTAAWLGFTVSAIPVTTSATDPADYSGRVVTNEGATSKPTRTLPAITQGGHTVTYVVQDADGIRVQANTGDTIRMGPKVTAAAGYIESTTIGSTVTLVAINAAEWIATSWQGTWTDGTFTASNAANFTP